MAVLTRLLTAGNGMTFLTLLPPREALESQDPLRAQLDYHPKTAEVVRLSDVLQVCRPCLALQTRLMQ